MTIAQKVADFQQAFINNHKERWPKNTWLVVIELREKGAIGDFTPTLMLTLAEPDDVTRFILDDAKMLGLEPRSILTKTKLT